MAALKLSGTKNPPTVPTLSPLAFRLKPRRVIHLRLSSKPARARIQWPYSSCWADRRRLLMTLPR